MTALPTLEQYRALVESRVETLLQHVPRPLLPTFVSMDQEGEIVTAPVVFVMAEPELRMVREMGRRFAVAAGAALMALVLEGERALAPDGSANAQLIEQGDWDELPPDDRERQIIFYLEDCTGATLVRTYTPTEQGSLQPSTDHGENEAMIEEWWPLLPTNRLREHAGVARQN